MRVIFTLLIALLLVSCGGGGGSVPVQDTDPTGHWQPTEGVGFEISKTGDGLYVLRFDERDLAPLYLTSEGGNEFSFTGQEVDVTGNWRTEWEGSMTFNNDILTGNSTGREINLGTGEIEEFEPESFSATRTPQ